MPLKNIIKPEGINVKKKTGKNDNNHKIRTKGQQVHVYQ